jgi:hypothetical protein
MLKKLIPLGSLSLVPLAAMAQEEQTCSLGYRIIEGVLPVIIIFLLLALFLRFTMKKNRSYQQRAIEHMDRIEQKYDRIIELLAKLSEKQQ